MLHSHIVPGTPTTELLPTARFLTADEVRQPRRDRALSLQLGGRGSLRNAAVWSWSRFVM